MPTKKTKQETFSFGYGNNDYLSDLGNPDIKDKMGATAFQPDPVGVQMGLVNEFNEDLEYNHVDDATKDKYVLSEKQKQTLNDYLKDINEALKNLEEDSFGGSELYTTDNLVGDIFKPTYRQGTIDERNKKYMDGSIGVDVKKQCRLGGLGNTSKACNQGEIDNLIFSKIGERMDERYDYEKIKRDLEARGLLKRGEEKKHKKDLKLVSYTVLELRSNAKKRLIDRFKKIIPKDWKTFGNYLIINKGPIDKKMENYLGLLSRVNILGYFISDNALCAFGRFETEEDIFNVLIATKGEIKNKDEFELCYETPPKQRINFKRPIHISGMVKELPLY